MYGRRWGVDQLDTKHKEGRKYTPDFPHRKGRKNADGKETFCLKLSLTGVAEQKPTTTLDAT
jgi:hypothetical protein